MMVGERLDSHPLALERDDDVDAAAKFPLAHILESVLFERRSIQVFGLALALAKLRLDCHCYPN